MKAISHKELAAIYGVTTRTLSRWLLPFNQKINRRKGQKIYTPNQIKEIYKNIGEP